ncbi:MAG: cupin-like domain-containing protein [Bdellovibrionales bacterium]|nr:cupin-like domain-containing protein [Oligoflexia bacterium]
MPTSVTPSLAALIAPHTEAYFLNEYWPVRPFALHGERESVSSLKEIPQLQSLDSLLNAWPFAVQAHLPDAADEISSIHASPADAKKLFTNKMSLLFNEAEKISPLLQKWLKALKADLGLPAMTYARCMVYATPDGKGTAPHFDQNINFILQLTGTKKWWLAPNRQVAHPSQRHTLGQALDPELASYMEGEFPKAMPADADSITLQPGSLLFVPQGYWHSTEASGEALSLNFTFGQPSFLDLFTAALRSRLLLSPEWRELADGVSSKDPERREYAEMKFDALLMELTQDLPHWRASDILGATEL